MATSQQAPAGDTIRFRPEDLVDRVPDEGWYRVVVGGVWKRPTDRGSTAVKTKFVITDDGDFEGVELWDQFVVEVRETSESEEGEAVARRRLARLMRAAGIAVVADKDLPLQGLVGREALQAKIAADKFQGQIRAKVKGYRPLAARAPDAS